MTDEPMLWQWAELGWFHVTVTLQKGQPSQREISRRVWGGIMAGKKARDWIPVLMAGDTRYCPIRCVWSCGFWAPAFFNVEEETDG